MNARFLPTLVTVVTVSFHVILCSRLHTNFSISVSDDSSTCAPWHYVDPSTGKCKCFHKRNLIKCTDEGTLLRIGCCTTYTENKGLFMARCPYFKAKRYAHTRSRKDPQYVVLPQNVSQLNDYMCGPINRKGYLCSECIDGFSPSFTSPDYMLCSNCTTSRYYGVPLYVLSELVPITLFYLTFLLLQINITSSPMMCYIFYSQLMMITVTPAIKSELVERNVYFFQNSLDVATYTLYGMWNLDFFRYSLPPFCVSNWLNTTQVITLGYISVSYPLCMIVLTVILVKLHDHNFKAIVRLWRPFHKCFTRIRRGWNTKSDLINVFATFLLLSYSKLLYLLVTFAEGATVYTMNNDTGITYNGVFSFSDIDIIDSHRGKYHTLFIILAGLVLIVTLLPVFLLLFYPVRMFQRCLSMLRLDFVFISIFVERFYSCYKDGLDGGRDMRSFAGFYFLLRLFLCLSTASSSHMKLLSSGFSVASLVFISAAMLISLIRPYKRMYINVLDTLLLSLLAAIFHLLSTDYIPAKGILTSVAILVPAVVFWICFIFIVCKKLKKQYIQSNYRNLTQEVIRYGST